MADVMGDDEWQAYMTREAARAIGGWLEARGRLHQPISALMLVELEALAMSAISRFVVLGMERIRSRPGKADQVLSDSTLLTQLLLA